jgi:hypothetical protein
MTGALTDLRHELRDDLQAVREFDAVDWVRRGLEVGLAPGIILRGTVHVCGVIAATGRQPEPDTVEYDLQPRLAVRDVDLELADHGAIRVCAFVVGAIWLSYVPQLAATWAQALWAASAALLLAEPVQIIHEVRSA